MIQIYLFVVTPAMLYLAFKRDTENDRIQKSYKNKSEKEKIFFANMLEKLNPYLRRRYGVTCLQSKNNSQSKDKIN